MRDLTTERLLLRRFTLADLDDLAALHGDPDVMRYIDDGKPVARDVVANQTLPRIVRSYEQHPPEIGQFAAVERTTGAFVGWVSLLPASSVGLEDVEGLELGYRLLPAAWGHGYAAEGARALLRQAFARHAGPGFDRVVATTMTVNTGSRRVMEKAGLVYARTFFAEWPDPIDGAEHGDVVYERTREDWLAETS